MTITPHPRPDKPTLFAMNSDGRTLSFLFAQCSCGHLNFPANAPGCVVCGDPLSGSEQVARPGLGVLRERVTIHLPVAPGIKPPLTIGRIHLADGVVEEGVLDISSGDVLPGARVQAFPLPSLDGATYGCIFRLAEETAQ